MTQQQIIDTDAAFRLRCRCGKSDHLWLVTPPAGEPRCETMCSVCAAQVQALGYDVTLVG